MNNLNRRHRSALRSGPGRQCGFSLIEFMVAITIAALLLLGLATLFATASRNFGEEERASRQIENGRYAMDLMAEDFRHAGFYGEIGDVTQLPNGAIPLPTTAMPDPCVTAVASVKAALSLPIQGYNGSQPTCLPDYVAGTDVVVIRRANTTTAATAVANEYYAQTSFCATTTTYFDLTTSSFPLTIKDCSTIAPIRKYHVHIYFIMPCSLPSDTVTSCAANPTARQVPTLARMELRLNSAGTAGIYVTPLVEGIENMQIEYGLDTNNDGAPDSFTADPTAGNVAATITAWSQVVAVRISLVARNPDITPGYQDTKTYALGSTTVGPYNDAYKRHAFSELVRLVDISQRKETRFP